MILPELFTLAIFLLEDSNFTFRWVLIVDIGMDHLSAPPSFPALKKAKASLLKEQERLNTERKALNEPMQGMSEAYRAIDEQMRQVQRQRQRGTVQRRDEFSL